MLTTAITTNVPAVATIYLISINIYFKKVKHL